MTTASKFGVIVAGYVAAFVAASAAFMLRLVTESGPDTSGGMYAAGDLFLFLGVFGIAALPPTGLTLWFLRSNRVAWTTLAILGVAIAMTGVGAVILYRSGGSDIWTSVSPLRILAAPLLTLAFFMSALIAPYRFPRIALLLAALCEAAISVWAGVRWFFPLHR
jgi:hypothetical protein